MAKESSSSSSSGSRDLQCVGRLEIVRPKPVGFLCGSIPVPTDKAFHDISSALVPSTETLRAPRYRMIPTETDLNRPPLVSSIPEKVLPVAAVQSRPSGDLPMESGAITSTLVRKGEALAVSGLAEYGDEIDVIAPADIMKQIFKIPYSKARLSIAVHRVGQTLVMNMGPDVEEGEKLVRKHSNQSKCADQSLFLNFAMHSVRMEACDCPPTHDAPPEDHSSVLPGRFESSEESLGPSHRPAQGHRSRLFGNSDYIGREEGFSHNEHYPRVKQDPWEKKKNKRGKRQDAGKKISQVKEKSTCSLPESEKYGRFTSDAFLRVLFWQFHNFRMLLGSDLLIFSNEKYVAVSLHLWDVSRKATPLTWLEAWLDNVMASVPELAICYHQDGVVQGYELLKTDDIFLLKGVSDDGTPAFHPHVVQHNALSVLRFVQENCKQDPGAYWLYKSAGEDVIQLFDLSVIPNNHTSDDLDDCSSSLPSLVHRGRNDYVLSLGMLLYRIAHRLSLSVTPNNRARRARFFKECLVFLDDPDHLVVRASAHEQFARLLLSYDEELDVTSDMLLLDAEATVAVSEEESFVSICGISKSIAAENMDYPTMEDETTEDAGTFQNCDSEISVKSTFDEHLSASRTLITADEKEPRNLGGVSRSIDQMIAVCEPPLHAAHTVADPISSKLAAIQHVSEAIKSLRWKRKLQDTEVDLDRGGKARDRLPLKDLLVCACGDADCIESCDIREWLPTSKLDDKLWKLVLLLGESYLALGQAFMDDGQLHQALNVVELACLVYGSMPQHLEDTRFVSSMVCASPTLVDVTDRSSKSRSLTHNRTKLKENGGWLNHDQLSSTYLFWAKAWILVGDVYVEFYRIKGKEISMQPGQKPFNRELRMSSEVLKEVERLKKKLGKSSQNCTSCSLINCSCQSDRASSGSSASSSTGAARPLGSCRKQTKKSHAKSTSYSLVEYPEDDSVHHKGELGEIYESECVKLNETDARKEVFDMMTDDVATGFNGDKGTVEMHNAGSTVDAPLEINCIEVTEVKSGGIFKYLKGPITEEYGNYLSSALSCYEDGRKALGENSTSLIELQSIIKKEGWVCNEMGRYWLEKREFEKAEHAFTDAIIFFKEVSDHTNIVLIYCNLGHGRRAVAEEMVSSMDSLRKHTIFHSAYNQAVETAILEYCESLMCYGSAKREVSAIALEPDFGWSSLKNEVDTQFANTYLRLGMLLAVEDTVAEVYEDGVLEGGTGPFVRRAKKELRKHKISANEAIREALSLYESLGDLRKQEAAYAYFQLACYQRDCCLKFLDSVEKKSNLPKNENTVLQRVKQYASLAERNWQKSIDFYGPKTHPVMYLTILIERSALSLHLSSSFNSNTMLESALTRLLEGHHIACDATPLNCLSTNNPELCSKFWSQLQTILKKMVATALPTNNTNKSSSDTHQPPPNRYADIAKLKELYKLSLKYPDFPHLHAMYSLWSS